MRWPKWLGGPSAHDDRYIDDWLRGIEPVIATATGLRVTVENALAIPGISACIQVQSEDIAKVPLDLKRRTNDGYESATEHPLYHLLKFGPAPWQSPYRWRKSMAHSTIARGNHYSRVWWSERGALEKITPVQSGYCKPRWGNDGEPFFDVTGNGQTEIGLGWQDIIHVAYRDSDDGASNGGITGISPITQNKEAVALMLASERFAGLFFRNGATPSLILETDKRFANQDVADRMRAGLERVYAGIDNKWKVAILEMGMKAREVGVDPSKSQLIETRRHAAELAATMLRTPPHKIGILDKATFSNIEQQSIDYVTGALSSLAKSIESAITIACLTPREREIYKVEHNLEGLMRGDVLSRYRAYAIGRQWGWLSTNDIRNRENENGIGPDGDEYLVPMNMHPTGQSRDDDQPADDKQRAIGNDASPGRLAAPAYHFVSLPRGGVRAYRLAPPRATGLVDSLGQPIHLP